MANSITNPLYPRPSRYMSGGSSTPVVGQLLTVTSTAAVQFAAFNQVTLDGGVVVLDVSGADVWCTFDDTTPSATSGHVITAGSPLTWSPAAAKAAKFVATTTANARVYLSEFTI